MGARIIRQGVVARTKARCHPHTGGEDHPNTATTSVATDNKANNNNKRGGNETPAASSEDKRSLPLLRRVKPIEVRERGSKKRKVQARQGGGSLRIPTSEEKQGWPTRAPPQCKKQGCTHRACPTEEGFRSCVGITLPQHHGEHATQQGCVVRGAGARAE